jgi:hypothetical protein
MAVATYRCIMRKINSGKGEVLTGTEHLRAAIRSVANVLNLFESLVHLVRGSNELALLELTPIFIMIFISRSAQRNQGAFLE